MTDDIEFTEKEKALLAKIDFEPSTFREHEPDYWQGVGEAAAELMELLLARDAIPDVRKAFFTEPELNIGGRGVSHLQVFERNGTRGDAVFRHPHFLRYLHYFVYGPDLPAAVVEAFQQRVSDCGNVTSGDIIPLGKAARELARGHALDAAHAAEEFFKLALECGLPPSDARSIRDTVRRR